MKLTTALVRSLARVPRTGNVARFFGTEVQVTKSGQNKFNIGQSATQSAETSNNMQKVLKADCGDIPEDDEMEQEEMFVDPHESFEVKTREWGGPRRGGRLPEPTRFGDWERKGRCTDF